VTWREFPDRHQTRCTATYAMARLAAATPILPGLSTVAFLDIDDTVRQTYGYAKQGAGRGYSGVKGLNALLATVSTPLSAPVIAATRLRKGATNSVRGAAKLLAEALATAARAGATGLMTVRADSAFYSYPIIATARRAGARFSVTARLTRRAAAERHGAGRPYGSGPGGAHRRGAPARAGTARPAADGAAAPCGPWPAARRRRLRALAALRSSWLACRGVRASRVSRFPACDLRRSQSQVPYGCLVLYLHFRKHAGLPYVDLRMLSLSLRAYYAKLVSALESRISLAVEELI
jgi:hypothetical protein